MNIIKLYLSFILQTLISNSLFNISMTMSPIQELQNKQMCIPRSSLVSTSAPVCLLAQHIELTKWVSRWYKKAVSYNFPIYYCFTNPNDQILSIFMKQLFYIQFTFHCHYQPSQNHLSLTIEKKFHLSNSYRTLKSFTIYSANHSAFELKIKIFIWLESLHENFPVHVHILNFRHSPLYFLI